MTYGKSTYATKLLDPRWQRRWLERLNDAGFACQYCGDSKSTLHVHHRQYIKGREPWEYADTELVVLCDVCHENAHALRPLPLEQKRAAYDGPFGSLERARADCLDKFADAPSLSNLEAYHAADQAYTRARGPDGPR